jgi:hypothetical protein
MVCCCQFLSFESQALVKPKFTNSVNSQCEQPCAVTASLADFLLTGTQWHVYTTQSIPTALGTASNSNPSRRGAALGRNSL